MHNNASFIDAGDGKKSHLSFSAHMSTLSA